MSLSNSPSPFAAALIAGKSALQAIKGIRVLYCTDSFEIEIDCRPGKTKFVIDNGNQFNKREYARDYIVAMTELVNPQTGQRFQPVKGHRIREMIAGELTEFELLPFGDEDIYRLTDTAAHEYRIHTKQVE